MKILNHQFKTIIQSRAKEKNYGKSELLYLNQENVAAVGLTMAEMIDTVEKGGKNGDDNR